MIEKSSRFFIFFSLLFLVLVDAKLIFNSPKESCYLPNSCRWLEKSLKGLDESFLVCSRLDEKFDYNEFDNSTKGLCDSKQHTLNYRLMFKHDSSNGYIIDSRFNLYDIGYYIPKYSHSLPENFHYIIVNAKGFTIDCKSYIYGWFGARLDVWNSGFRFYIQEKNSLSSKLIRTCEDIDNSSLVVFKDFERNFIFSKSGIVLMLFFYNSKFDTPVCPIVFNNSNLDYFELNFMINSYYKKNVIKFLDYNSSDLKSRVESFSLFNFYGLDLDWSIINPVLFASTTTFRIRGVINSIQTDLFSKFVNLTVIIFDVDTLKSIIKRKGIDWIRGINSNIRVNMSDRKSINKSIRALKRVS